MAVGVLMPKAGITVEECVITRWKKKTGDRVKVGDILFAYETDKAAFECESTAEGEILEIFYDEGAEVPVLVNVCAVGEPGEDISFLHPQAGEKPAEADNAQNTVAAGDTPAAGERPAVPDASGGELKISPRARNLAEKTSVNSLFAKATGPYGRIVEADIRKLASEGAGGTGIGGRITAADKAVPVQTAAASPARGLYEDIPFTKIRAAIAEAMSRSLSTAAQLTHHHSFDASNILAFRKGIKEKGAALGLPDITINDIILYTVSRVLPNHPDLNAHLLEGSVLRRFKDAHLGIAVDTPRGLMVPTLFNANRKTLAEISAEAKELSAQAKSGTINPDLLQGATFTVSNLGALGVEMFTPVLNPPQTGILGVCCVTTRWKETAGEYKPYPAMGLSVTYDHRAVDGAPEARFALELAGYLENFSLLLAQNP